MQNEKCRVRIYNWKETQIPGLSATLRVASNSKLGGRKSSSEEHQGMQRKNET